jgi:hypothetical protein
VCSELHINVHEQDVEIAKQLNVEMSSTSLLRVLKSSLTTYNLPLFYGSL